MGFLCVFVDIYVRQWVYLKEQTSCFCRESNRMSTKEVDDTRCVFENMREVDIRVCDCPDINSCDTYRTEHTENSLFVSTNAHSATDPLQGSSVIHISAQTGQHWCESFSHCPILLGGQLCLHRWVAGMTELFLCVYKRFQRRKKWRKIRESSNKTQWNWGNDADIKCVVFFSFFLSLPTSLSVHPQRNKWNGHRKQI